MKRTLSARSGYDILLKYIILPLLGFTILLGIWWFTATFLTNLMPDPKTAFLDNLDYVLNPFYVRGPGDVGIGYLLGQSLQRVLIEFLLSIIMTIPLVFLFGLSEIARRTFDPILQIIRSLSPLAWLPIAKSD